MNTTAHVSLVEGARFDEPHVRAVPQSDPGPARLLPPGQSAPTLAGLPAGASRPGNENQNWDWIAWRLEHPVTLPSPLNDVA